ncbi:TOBE domain-containing protein [Rhizobium sp. EC-SD404]|uniref:TOBE domain-containing protein n=1 Tax=Rhizobium sp. EC-SD404 TaxID=2038389 RepID=UPI00125144BC|nr:TOBE domain-containing protein [Rhizobium sp. EC-SD404]VVT24249.1 putative molybdenum-pterin-binding protein [Rhizobium sp. EC-SD404]
MKLSARNVFEGKIVEITRGAVAGKVKIDIGGGHFVTSTVTVEAIDDLNLSEGKTVTAIVKSSDIILGVE